MKVSIELDRAIMCIVTGTYGNHTYYENVFVSDNFNSWLKYVSY